MFLPLVATLSGAGLDSSIWDRCSMHWNYKTLHLEYPNRGNSQNLNKHLTLEDYYASLLQQLEAYEEEKLVLVAHSLGGIFLHRLAEYLGNNLIGIITVGAVIPAKGEIFFSGFPLVQRLVTNLMMRISGTHPPDSAIRNSLCNQLPKDLTDQIVRSFTPESRNIYTATISYEIPKTNSIAIILEDDRSLTRIQQRKFSEKLNTVRTYSINSGHLPMLSHPKQLAQVINEAVETCVAKKQGELTGRKNRTDKIN